MSSCTICEELWAFFAASARGGKTVINLGSFDEALASTCTAHTPVVEGFKQYCDSDPESVARSSTDVGFINDGVGYSVKLFESVTTLGLYFDLLLAKKQDIKDHPGNGRVLDPDWVDLDIVRQWKQECLSSHCKKCENPMKIPQTTPAWLVDLERNCLVPGQSHNNTPYITLSYRLGDAAPFRLSETELDIFREDGSLSKPELLSQLPSMIRHAMSLTKSLGERYLWTDALCIVHGNHAVTMEQLNLMAAIYASALYTIIVDSDSGVDGIPGLDGISGPRNLRQRIFSFGEDQLLVRNTGMFSMESGPYHTRGWTYQEFTMAPRRLIFMKNEVHWQCQTSLWYEELTLNTEMDKYIDPRPKVLSAGFPDLESLGHMLCSYNERELTFDSDALAAISGLLTVLSRTFHGGFLFGLPEMFFDRVLAWEPYWPFTNLRKRDTSDKPAQVRLDNSDLPSWSWLSWQGMFSFRYGEPVRMNDRVHSFEEVTPITEWYTSSTSNGRPLRRIHSTWFQERHKRKYTHEPLPNGWTRHAASSIEGFRDEPRLFPDDCEEFLYEHHSMPESDCKFWYYPFYVPDIQPSTRFFIPEQTRYLFCKTWKASLWSHRFIHDRFTHDANHILKLRKSADEPIIGTLQLHTDEQMELWPEPGPENNAEQGRTIEIVAINRCVRHSKTFNEELQRYDLPLNREERVTVLWVEWKSGIAYRLGCGKIDKEGWESLERHTVDLTLG